jgi:GT2 family glycosyltransferase
VSMKISVVIPTYNNRAGLDLVLLSLGHNRLGPEHEVEVVVVDDGSTDDTADILAGHPSGIEPRYLYLPRTRTSSRAAARNAGIAVATGELVVFLDTDQIVVPTLLAEHVRFHELRQDLVVVGPRHALAPGEPNRTALANGFRMDALPPVESVDPRIEVLAGFSANLNNMATCWTYLYTCNASVRREHLLAVGGFDESFLGWGMEDTDLGYRLRQRGLAFAVNPAAVQYHRPASTNARQYAECRRNLDRMIRKNRHVPEIALQSMTFRVQLSWVDSMRRFEYAVRALHGRLPRGTEPEVVEAVKANTDVLVAALPAMAASHDLAVVDRTADARLAGPVQCLDSPHELLYFHRPTGRMLVTGPGA